MAFAPGCFLWPSFCRSFPWSQICRISENPRWRSPWQICIARVYGHFVSCSLQQNVVLGWHFKCMLIRTWWHLRQGVFCGLLFAGVSLGRNFEEFQKTRSEGLLGKFTIARLYFHFGSRGLQQNVVLGWHFKCILIRTWWHLRQGFFCGFLFAGVSPGRNFAEFQKTRAECLLGKFAIARLYGHFESRGLQQNVVLGWHFNCILIRTWRHLRQGNFCGLFFAGVSPGRNFAEFQKTRAEGLPAKFAIARLYGHFKGRGLQQNVVLCWHFKWILNRRWWHLRQGVFFGLFLQEFNLVATLQNFRKRAMRVSLPNLP